jgi:hypothetical protein
LASNTSKAGLIAQLFEMRLKFLLVDKLGKMDYSDEGSLLHLIGTGIIAETRVRKTKKMEMDFWVFSTANSIKKLPGLQ